jgi:hypothetical protein
VHDAGHRGADLKDFVNQSAARMWAQRLELRMKGPNIPERFLHYGTSSTSALEYILTWRYLKRRVVVRTRRISWFGRELRKRDRFTRHECRICTVLTGEVFYDKPKKEDQQLGWRKSRRCVCGPQLLLLYDHGWKEHVDKGSNNATPCEETQYVCMCQMVFHAYKEWTAHKGAMKRYRPAETHEEETDATHAEALRKHYCGAEAE